MENVVRSALSFAAIFGDSCGRDVVWPYLYGEHGVFDLLELLMPKGKYGEDLDLILIVLHVEGDHEWFDIPAKPTLGRYSKKDKSIRYSVPVTQDSFFERSSTERKEFLVKQMCDAVRTAWTRLGKKGFKADFEQLQTDLEKVVCAYRRRPAP